MSLQLAFRVIAVDDELAYLKLSDDQSASGCQQCQQRGSCQSLSVYHWLFPPSPLTVAQSPQQPFVQGEYLSFALSSSFFRNILLILWGLPLAGFILMVSLSVIWGEVVGFLLGISVGIVLYRWGRQYILMRVTQLLQRSYGQAT